MDHEKESYSFQEACDSLGLSAQMLRRLLREYRDVLHYSDQESEASSRYMGSESVETARVILALTAAGLDKHQIMERLAIREAAKDERPESTTAFELLLGKIEVLQKELAESERRRAEDRDKMLTTLAKVQQELNRLKNEIAIADSRKNRRKKGFWGTLLQTSLTLFILP